MLEDGKERERQVEAASGGECRRLRNKRVKNEKRSIQTVNDRNVTHNTNLFVQMLDGLACTDSKSWEFIRDV